LPEYTGQKNLCGAYRMLLDILNTRQVKKLKNIMEAQFGIQRLPDFVYLMNRRSKVFVTNRHLQDIETDKLNLERVGMYFREFKNEAFRLSIEASQLVGDSANKNVVELSLSQARAWLQGTDLEIESPKSSFVIVKHKNNYLGCGKLTNNKLHNFVPKTRRSKVVI